MNVMPLLPSFPSEIEDIWVTYANQITAAAKEIRYYPHSSSHWGINE